MGTYVSDQNKGSSSKAAQLIWACFCTKWKQVVLFLLPMILIAYIFRHRHALLGYSEVQVAVKDSVFRQPTSYKTFRPGWRKDNVKEDLFRSSLSPYPDLVFLALSNASVTTDMSPAVAENNFYRYIEHVDLSCIKFRRFGGAPDGGWDWCLVGPYIPKTKQCLVYSFGIGSVWTFDDAISNPKEYGCIDRAFDPTNGLKPHVRKQNIHFYDLGIGGVNKVDQLIAYNIKHAAMTLRTFADFREKLNETDVVLDYLKMDVEYSEWEAFKTILYNGDLRNVKQIGLELHTNEVFAKRESSVKLLTVYYNILKGIENSGFLKYQTHANMAATYKSKKTGMKRTCCYEMKWININVLTGEFPPKIPLATDRQYSWAVSPSDAEKQFEIFVHGIHTRCEEYQTFGATTGEQWRICTNPKSGWKSPCSIGSIGVKEITSFEKDVKEKLGCEVEYWKLTQGNSQDILKNLNQLSKIDFLKIDLDHMEWTFLDDLIKSGILKKVSQIGLEIHIEEFIKSVTEVKDYERYYDTIIKLEVIGFKKWFVMNSQFGMYDSSRTGDRTTNAFKLYYIKA